MNTFWGRRGGRIGGLIGPGGGGAEVVVMRTSTARVVVRHGDRHSGVVGGDWGIGNVVGGVSICIMRCLRMVPMRSRWSRLVALRWCGMRPLILLANFLASAMTRSEGVMDGFVRYLCLWKTVAETRVNCVSFIHMVQAR